MAHKSKSKRPRKSRSHSVHKPRGVIHPRVQAVGPEHFAFVCIDCAKSRSKMMLADFYGRVHVEPVIVEHDQPGFAAATQQVRDAMREAAEVAREAARQAREAVREVGARERPPRRELALGAVDAREIRRTRWLAALDDALCDLDQRGMQRGHLGMLLERRGNAAARE